jgi:hypothetical protein
MNNSKKTGAVCASMLFCIMSGFINAHADTPPKDTPRNEYGRIHFNDDKGQEKCTLAVPDTKQIFNFSANNEYCENNMVSTFWLENIPSATLIQFYEGESCSDANAASNFYFKLKTTKQPTDWSQAPNPAAATLSIDELRKSSAGELITQKNTRVEAAFVGGDFATDNLNERLSCVYIERSQPVNP